MNTGNPHQRVTARKLWQRNGLIWVALMALLTLTLVLAYVPMGVFTPSAGIAIAFIKAGLVVMLFMDLAGSRPLIRLAAAAGLVFLAVFFALTLADVLSRMAQQ
jgi:cytochrome c oxidase subunit 4